MKQILQNLSTGESESIEAPAPQARRGSLLIDTSVSLISTGTEPMLVDFGKSALVAMAHSQPEIVRQALDKVATDGLMTTVDAVRSKLGQPIPLGYCNVGMVRDAGAEGFKVGDRVPSNGPHADVLSVPRNLNATIPDCVSDDAASFIIVASIGLQGLRLAQPTPGEAFVVMGGGLIGLLTVQLLGAQGCQVLAIDFGLAKLELACSFGAEICNPGAGQGPIAAGNRCFATQIQTIKRLLRAVTAPQSFVMVTNAGAIPANHWTQDPAAGDGRTISEASHYVDLTRFLAGALIISVQARRMGGTDAEAVTEDKASITLDFEDGSFGTIHYLANGGTSFAKERIEVFAAERTFQLDNFLKFRGFNWPVFKKQNPWRQDKRQPPCAAAFVKAVEAGGAAPIPAEKLFEVAKVTIEVAEILSAQA